MSGDGAYPPTEHVDLLIIGGGPAGMAAAIRAREAGLESILLVERDYGGLGGILNQCIHSGFGLDIFGEELTGPEYAERYITRLRELGITICLGTMVLDLTADKAATVVGEDGLRIVKAKAVVLATGCRERPRGALNIPGSRPAGVFTAGTAQKFVNLDGYMPGREAVVLGSGDIGLIMARRMTLEGATVKAVVELLPYSSGLRRNIVQCLDDFGIPLLLSHTVTRVIGRPRLSAVEIMEVDAGRVPVPGTEKIIPCDTLLLSVGLIPENEIARAAGVEISPRTGGAVVGESLQTSIEGIFACGNALHVNDLADFASREGMRAGASAAKYVGGEATALRGIPVRPGRGVRYCVPFFVDRGQIADVLEISLRVDAVYRDQSLVVRFDGERVFQKRARIHTPGEMERIPLKKALFNDHPNIEEISVGVEEAQA